MQVGLLGPAYLSILTFKAVFPLPSMETRLAPYSPFRKGRIVIKLCLGVDVAKSEDEEFSVVDAVEFSPESLDFRVY